MNLIQLKYARSVTSCGSFTRAADECNVTQPTLSNGIAQLEQELGMRLFNRTTRTVTLTPFGEYILPYMERVLQAHRILEKEITTFKHSSVPAVRLGVSSLIQPEWLEDLLKDFSAAYPAIVINLEELRVKQLYQKLNDKQLDFIFTVRDMKRNFWECCLLYEDPLLFLPCGKSKEISHVTLEEIADETFLMVAPDCGLTGVIRALFRSQRKKIKEYPGQVLSYELLEKWPGMALGAAIIPQSKLSTPRKGLRITDKKGKQITMTFEGSWLKEKVKDPTVRIFAEYLKNRQNKKPG